MNWGEFEILCRGLINESIDERSYRTISQYCRQYNQGQNYRMDFHIAERRQGGRGYVIDCKHYVKNEIPAAEVDSVLEYMTACKASKGFILLSQDTRRSAGFDRRIEELDGRIEVIVIRTGGIGKIERVFKSLFGKPPLDLQNKLH